MNRVLSFFFFQAEDGIRDLVRSRGLGDVYKRQQCNRRKAGDASLTARDRPTAEKGISATGPATNHSP